MQLNATLAALCIAAALLLCAPGAVRGQSILLVDRESMNGQAMVEPLPVREGVDASLFESGLIVFDVPGDPPGREELLRIARSAGADVVLTISATWEVAAAAIPARMTGTASFSTFNAVTGAAGPGGSVTATNKDREKDVDRAGLGAEIGAEIARRIRQALPGTASSSP
jgi:hypothetical protein